MSGRSPQMASGTLSGGRSGLSFSETLWLFVLKNLKQKEPPFHSYVSLTRCSSLSTRSKRYLVSPNFWSRWARSPRWSFQDKKNFQSSWSPPCWQLAGTWGSWWGYQCEICVYGSWDVRCRIHRGNICFQGGSWLYSCDLCFGPFWLSCYDWIYQWDRWLPSTAHWYVLSTSSPTQTWPPSTYTFWWWLLNSEFVPKSFRFLFQWFLEQATNFLTS